MKKHLYYLFVIMLAGFLCFLATSSHSIPRITMVDASVPKSEQSLIVVVNSKGEWDNTILEYVDDIKLKVSASMFYIPSGTRTLSFQKTYTDVTYERNRDGDTIKKTTTTTASLRITDRFLPEHTYRITTKGAKLMIEDITGGGIDWLPPQVSPESPNNGVLTNWERHRPRGLYIMPAMNGGSFFQYARLPGKDALISSYNDNQVIYSERGYTGINAFNLGGSLQFGLDVGINKLGLVLLGELNGGWGFGGGKYNASGFNWGRLLVGELYRYNAIGVGAGYGKTTTLYNGSDKVVRHAYENTHPFYRFQLSFLSESLLSFLSDISTVTVYTDYYFKHKAWSFGIQFNFEPRGVKNEDMSLKLR